VEEKEDFSMYREVRWYLKAVLNRMRKRPPPPKIKRRVIRDSDSAPSDFNKQKSYNPRNKSLMIFT